MLHEGYIDSIGMVRENISHTRTLLDSIEDDVRDIRLLMTQRVQNRSDREQLCRLLQAENDSLKEQLHILQIEREEETLSHTEERESLQRELAEKELVSQAEMERVLNQLSELSQEKAETARKAQELETYSLQLEEQLQSYYASIQSLEKERESLQQRLSESERERETLTLSHTEAHTQLAALQQEMQALLERYERETQELTHSLERERRERESTLARERERHSEERQRLERERAQSESLLREELEKERADAQERLRAQTERDEERWATERARQREKERQWREREKEIEKERQRETAEVLREMHERDALREKELREKEREWSEKERLLRERELSVAERERELERERDRVSDRGREREEEIERLRVRESERDRERVREKKDTLQREREMQEELERMKDAMCALTERERKREKERERERERERGEREKEREEEQESRKALQRELEEEKERRLRGERERERDRDREREKEREKDFSPSLSRSKKESLSSSSPLFERRRDKENERERSVSLSSSPSPERRRSRKDDLRRSRQRQEENTCSPLSVPSSSPLSAERSRDFSTEREGARDEGVVEDAETTRMRLTEPQPGTDHNNKDEKKERRRWRDMQVAAEERKQEKQEEKERERGTTRSLDDADMDSDEKTLRALQRLSRTNASHGSSHAHNAAAAQHTTSSRESSFSHTEQRVASSHIDEELHMKADFFLSSLGAASRRRRAEKPVANEIVFGVNGEESQIKEEEGGEKEQKQQERPIPSATSPQRSRESELSIEEDDIAPQRDESSEALNTSPYSPVSSSSFSCAPRRENSDIEGNDLSTRREKVSTSKTTRVHEEEEIESVIDSAGVEERETYTDEVHSSLCVSHSSLSSSPAASSPSTVLCSSLSSHPHNSVSITRTPSPKTKVLNQPLSVAKYDIALCGDEESSEERQRTVRSPSVDYDQEQTNVVVSSTDVYSSFGFAENMLGREAESVPITERSPLNALTSQRLVPADSPYDRQDEEQGDDDASSLQWSFHDDIHSVRATPTSVSHATAHLRETAGTPIDAEVELAYSMESEAMEIGDSDGEGGSLFGGFSSLSMSHSQSSQPQSAHISVSASRQRTFLDPDEEENEEEEEAFFRRSSSYGSPFVPYTRSLPHSKSSPALLSLEFTQTPTQRAGRERDFISPSSDDDDGALSLSHVRRRSQTVRESDRPISAPDFSLFIDSEEKALAREREREADDRIEREIIAERYRVQKLEEEQQRRFQEQEEHRQQQQRYESTEEPAIPFYPPPPEFDYESSLNTEDFDESSIKLSDLLNMDFS